MNFFDKNKRLLAFLLLAVGAVVYLIPHPPKWIRNYLPDFLWAVSLTAALSVIHGNTKNRKKIFWISFSVSALYEFGQLFSLFAGTFDIFDLLVYLAGIFMVLYFIS